MTVLLRRMICDHLRRARLEKILNVFQRIRLRFSRACGLASSRTSFASSRRHVRQAPSRMLKKEGKGSLGVLLLAGRARSEGARSTRAIEDRPGHPLEIV